MPKEEERLYREELENEHGYYKEFEEKFGEEGSWRHGVGFPEDLCELRPRVV